MLTSSDIEDLIEKASEKAWENDQEITLRIEDGTALVEVTVGPETIGEARPTVVLPWPNILIRETSRVLLGLMVLVGFFFLLGGKVQWPL